MSEPIVVISNLRLKEGRFEEYKQFTRETTKWLETNRPRTLAILEYFSENSAELSIVIIFADADAMQVHMQGLGELPTKSFEYLEPVSLRIYGMPNEATLQMMKNIAVSEAAFNIRPQAIGGYIRLKAE